MPPSLAFHARVGQTLNPDAAGVGGGNVITVTEAVPAGKLVVVWAGEWGGFSGGGGPLCTDSHGHNYYILSNQAQVAPGNFAVAIAATRIRTPLQVGDTISRSAPGGVPTIMISASFGGELEDPDQDLQATASSLTTDPLVTPAKSAAYGPRLILSGAIAAKAHPAATPYDDTVNYPGIATGGLFTPVENTGARIWNDNAFGWGDVYFALTGGYLYDSGTGPWQGNATAGGYDYVAITLLGLRRGGGMAPDLLQLGLGQVYMAYTEDEA